MEKIVMGITGTNGAGKGTIVEYLVEKRNFKHLSASGLITEEIEKRGLPVDRDSMRMVANDLRVEFGAGYIVEELLRRSEKIKNNLVIESIRTLGEIEKLRENGAILLAVDAEPEIRYQRILKRGSNKDKVSFEEFVKQERKEWTSSDPNKQNLLACKKAANYVIENNGTFEELDEKIEKILNIIQKNDR